MLQSSFLLEAPGVAEVVSLYRNLPQFLAAGSSAVMVGSLNHSTD